MKNPLEITLTEARQLAVQSQGLDRLPDEPDRAAMLATIERIGCLQIDPLNVVARNPLLVLWSRLGSYAEADLDALLWEERALFEYWAHAASILLVADYPLHQATMREFAFGSGMWGERVRQWLADNASFRTYILDELARRGPLFATEIEDRAERPWQSSGWSNSRSVNMMLTLLWEQGEITVTRREGAGFGLKKQWGLLGQHMPQWVNHEPWPRDRVVREAALRALLALGVASERHITNYFMRNGYPDLGNALAELERDGRVCQVAICDDGRTWPGPWYIHADVLPFLDSLRGDGWVARTTLLSPFDNLIADRDRTEQLFDFYYRSEIYTPKAKRQYGYYVMPILQGERLIGRIDPKMDRKTKTLHVHAVHREPGAELGDEEVRAVAASIDELGRFLGAEQVRYGAQIAPEWRGALPAQN